MNSRLWDALNYQNYSLAQNLSKYNALVTNGVAKWKKWLQVKMNTVVLHSLDSISVIGLLSTIKPAWYKNWIHKMAAMWLLTFYGKKLAFAALTSLLEPVSKLHKCEKEATWPHYFEIFSYVLKTYATDHLWPNCMPKVWNSVAFKHDASRIRKESLEAGIPLQSGPRWKRPEGDVYWQTKLVNPTEPVFVLEL